MELLILTIFLLQLIEVLIILSLINDVQDIKADLYYYSELKNDDELKGA